MCAGGVDLKATALWFQEEGLEAAFIQHFSLDGESEACGGWRTAVEGWWEVRWVEEIKLSLRKLLLLSLSWWLPVGNEDSCQIFWVFRGWKSRFFKMGNLLFLKHCVGQTKHVCGLHSVCGLPFWDLWFIVLTKHDISVPICNLKACYFQTQFISVLHLPPSLLYYLYTCLTPPQDYTLFWWCS